MLCPKITIILPIYNAAETLAQCLQSIQAQTLGDFELLAIDDGSTDRSAQILKTTAQSDLRIRILNPGRLGLIPALNLGIRQAKAPLIARMDADDWMTRDRLQRQYDYLQTHPNLALVGSQVELFPQSLIQAGYQEYARWQNSCISPEQIAHNLYIESPLAHPSVMVRKAVLEQLRDVQGQIYRDGPFPEDYDLWLRLHQAGHQLGKVPKILLYWRDSSDRTSRTDPRYARPAFDRLRAHYLAQDARLQSAQAQGRGLIIWSAGRKRRKCVRLLTQRGIRIHGWVDLDPKKIGTTLWDCPIHHPSWLSKQQKTTQTSNHRPFVLIYVTNHGGRDRAIKDLLDWGYLPDQDFLSVG